MYAGETPAVRGIEGEVERWKAAGTPLLRFGFSIPRPFGPPPSKG